MWSSIWIWFGYIEQGVQYGKVVGRGAYRTNCIQISEIFDTDMHVVGNLQDICSVFTEQCSPIAAHIYLLRPHTVFRQSCLPIKIAIFFRSYAHKWIILFIHWAYDQYGLHPIDLTSIAKIFNSINGILCELTYRLCIWSLLVRLPFGIEQTEEFVFIRGNELKKKNNKICAE